MKQFITQKQPKRYMKPTLEQVLANVPIADFQLSDDTGTLTRFMEVPPDLQSTERIMAILEQIKLFNSVYRDVINTNDKSRFYIKGHIPKKSGGWREINAPNEEIRPCLDALNGLLKAIMLETYHTTAFAYVTGRNTVMAVKKHQQNDSHWFGKFDFSDFFGSTTFEFVMRMFEMIYPFGLVTELIGGREELGKMLSVCFLNGGLPQGSPTSPLITNIMMIPFDHAMNRRFQEMVEGSKQPVKDRYVYTRYADDIHISRYNSFDIHRVQSEIIKMLSRLRAPFNLNTDKTHYGSRSGSNYILGLCLNKDNQISIGHESKKEFKAMLNNYLWARETGNPFDTMKLYELQGKISYYLSVEKETIEYILNQYGKAHNVNVLVALSADIAR